jgi:hypothetical protein
VEIIHGLGCTGSDSVLSALTLVEGKKKKHWFSISIGQDTQRLYVFYAKQISFPNREFKKLTRPWQRAATTTSSSTDVREGIGCWHPTFPLKFDEIIAMASLATQQLNFYFNTPTRQTTELTVFERDIAPDGRLNGYKRLKPISE